MRLATIVTLVACLLPAATSSAKVFVEQLVPPSALRGATTRVVVSGSDLSTASGMWISCPGVTAKLVAASEADSCTFDLLVDAEARLGLFGLRVATADGLSNVHLFAIDDLPSTAERETVDKDVDNNKLLTAQRVELPTAVAGACGGADVDYYAINVQAGERVAFEVVGSRLGKALDPVVTILDEDGRFVMERDNDIGLFFDCRFQHTFAKGGRYFVRLHDSRYQGSQHWTYLLRMGRFPIARVALPSTAPAGAKAQLQFPQLDGANADIAFPSGLTTRRFFLDWRSEQDNASSWVALALSDLPNQIEQEPNEELEKPNEVQLPSNIHGMMNQPSDWDHYAFDLKRGQRIRVVAETRGMGSAADLELTLFGPDGKQLKQVDDSGFEDAQFDFTAAKKGRHVLRALEVVRKSGPAYVYRIELRNREPRLEATSEIGRLAVPAGTWQPLPLEIRRIDFSSPVQLELRGAPEGVRLLESTIAADQSNLVARIQVDAHTKPGVYTLQVVARGQRDGKEITAVANTNPLVDRLPTGRGPHGEPFELREDQRRLPPSLTDRIALVVLAESPFDFTPTSPLVVLPRYMQADFQLQTTRAHGFQGEIEFVPRGGQLEQERLRPPPIKWTLERQLPGQALVRGSFHSGVNTITKRQRVTVTGTAKQGERTIHLTRTFDLDVQVAFAPDFEVTQLKLAAGETGKVRLRANRLPPFAGPLQIRFEAKAGVKAPASVEIPAGADGVDVEFQIEPDASPGKHAVSVIASTRIAKFNEEGKGKTLEIVVERPAVKTKAP